MLHNVQGSFSRVPQAKPSCLGLAQAFGSASRKQELAGISILQEGRPRSQQLLGHRPAAASGSTESELLSAMAQVLLSCELLSPKCEVLLVKFKMLLPRFEMLLMNFEDLPPKFDVLC